MVIVNYARTVSSYLPDVGLSVAVTISSGGGLQTVVVSS